MSLIDREKTMKEIPIDVCDGFEVTDIIEKMPTVKAISLAKVKLAREEIEQAHQFLDGYDPQAVWDYISYVDEILDKLIESEEK